MHRKGRRVEREGATVRRTMSTFYIPSAGPDSWAAFLASPEKQFVTGYSARTMAYCWEAVRSGTLDTAPRPPRSNQHAQ